MTVRQARECVKNELGEQRRWEEEQNEIQKAENEEAYENERRWKNGVQKEEE